jgi:hypothetical protein
VKEEDLILTVNRMPAVDEFLKSLEVKPAGLGAQLFTEVYEQFFTWSTDLRDQYERYYCVEYPTLQRYLELAHEIYLTSDQLEKRYILKIKSPGGVVDQAYDDNILDVVIDRIKKLEESDENQD